MRLCVVCVSVLSTDSADESMMFAASCSDKDSVP